MPDLGDVEYMAEIANDVGIARQNPVDWVEIRAFTEATGIYLTAWEAKWLRQMSVAYVNQAFKSTDPACLPPTFTDNRTAEERNNEVAATFRRIVEARKGKK